VDGNVYLKHKLCPDTKSSSFTDWQLNLHYTAVTYVSVSFHTVPFLLVGVIPQCFRAHTGHSTADHLK